VGIPALQSHPFGHYPNLVTKAEVWNKDRAVKSKLRLLAPSSPQPTTKFLISFNCVLPIFDHKYVHHSFSFFQVHHMHLFLEHVSSPFRVHDMNPTFDIYSLAHLPKLKKSSIPLKCHRPTQPCQSFSTA